MAETNPTLGASINQLLLSKGIETPMSQAHQSDSRVIETPFREIMRYGIGLNLSDDSLQDTPKRIAKMYGQEIFYGLNYDNFPSATVIENKMQYNEVVAVGDIDVLSVCEHHFVPFIGKANVGYIPRTKVMGLSKFNRIVDFFSRRPQVQERLGEQIHAALSYILETDDVAVVIKAEHYCVKLRGVKQDSFTITSKLSGRFRSVPELRSEFFALMK